MEQSLRRLVAASADLGWLPSHFIAPPDLRRAVSASVLVFLLGAVGIADYASGLLVSLAIFYLLPILLARAWFGTRFAVVATFASVALRVLGDLAANDWHQLPLWSWWNALSSLTVFLFIVWLHGKLLMVLKELDRRVQRRSGELTASLLRQRQLEHELLEISASERNRMGEELHDDICQHLVATAFATGVLTRRLALEDNALAAKAQEIVGLIEDGIGRTRLLARGLLLSAIPPDRLAEKLTELAEEGSGRGVPCRFTEVGAPEVPDEGTAAQLYRIAQEAMRNAIHHSNAHRIDISLVGDASSVCLMVEDDGRGMDEDEPRSGMGLPIMMHRAAFIGASLTVVPTVGQGTKVVCHLPLQESAP